MSLSCAPSSCSPTRWRFSPRPESALTILWVIVGVTALLAYESVLVVSRGATLGKQLMSIHVVDEDGTSRPSWRQSIVRFAVPLLAWSA